MDCACLFNKVCGYYKNGVYVQLIRSTTRRYLRGRQHGPAGKCINPKNKPAKKLEITEILYNEESFRASVPQEKTINSKKISHCHLLLRGM